MAGKGQEREIGIQLQQCNAMVSSSLSEEGEKTEGRERDQMRSVLGIIEIACVELVGHTPSVLVAGTE